MSLAQRAERYNLNLAKTYLPNWGAWEVAREILCNAIDADPDYSATSPAPDKLIVSTRTTPSVAEMLVIGHGSKSIGGETIGQFGEGLKMAALAATRAGGSLVLKDANATVTFGFEDTLGVESLTAYIAKPQIQSGFIAEITMPLVGSIYKDRIITGLDSGPFRPSSRGHVQVYVKGVYITTISGESIWDWNFTNEMRLNRDRSMVSDFDVKFAAGQWLGQYMDADQAKALILTPGVMERDAMQYGKHYRNCNVALRKAFYEVHGQNAVLANGTSADHAAESQGFVVVTVNPPEFREVLHYSGIKLSEQVVGLSHRLDAVDPAPFSDAIENLRRLDGYINAPRTTIRVFADSGRHMGLADVDDMTIWLHQSLFLDGCERDLTATYLHEMAHIISKAADETREFESALDSIAASFALAVLGGDA